MAHEPLVLNLFREQNVQGNLKLATEPLAFKVLFIF